MYKNCYVVKKPDVWNIYDVHLWTDEGYTVEDLSGQGNHGTLTTADSGLPTWSTDVPTE